MFDYAPKVRQLQTRLSAFMDELNFKREWQRHQVITERAMALAPDMIVPGRSDNNIRPVTTEEIRRILTASLARYS
jgi:hypothetical protein